MKRVVTHKKPDADAIGAAWLAQRYLFEGEAVEVIFVPRSYRIDTEPVADCIVDIGNTYNPEQLRFDHKPPAFEDRNQSCASKLLWEHLLSIDKPVQHLAALITVVHEGDSNPPRKNSPQLSQSKKDGFHAHFVQTRPLYSSDAEFYAAMCLWLNDYDTTQPTRSVSEGLE